LTKDRNSVIIGTFAVADNPATQSIGSNPLAYEHYPLLGPIQEQKADSLVRVTYGGGLFVAVGDGVTLQPSSTYTNRNIYTTPDGIAWTARNCGAPAAEAQPIWDVAYGAGRFVAVDSGNHFYSSTTGLSWTRTTATNSGWINFSNGHFIAAAGPGTNLLSNDGVNWAAVGTGTTNSFNRTGSMTWGPAIGQRLRLLC